MSRQLKQTLAAFEVKDADKGQVEAVIATFDVVDKDGDVTLKGAIPEGSKVVISDFGHSAAMPWTGAKPAGKGVIHTDGEKAILVGQYFLKTAHGRDAFEVVKEMGAQQEWSYGYDVLKHQIPDDAWKAKGARRILEQLSVHEASPVLIGAGEGTMTLNTKELQDSTAARDAVQKEALRFEATRASLMRQGVALKHSPRRILDGQELTAGDFAYVPGIDPAAWQFALHDAAHVKAALAAWGSTELPVAGAKAVSRQRLLAAAARLKLSTVLWEKEHPA